MTAPAICLFRDDLRLADQPALAAASASGAPLLCLFVLDEETPGLRARGGASRWWLHHALTALSSDLARIGGRLDIVRGAQPGLVRALAKAAGAASVDWCRRYGAAEIAADRGMKADLAADGVNARSHNGALLFEPWEVSSKAGDPFKVFTPFWRTAMARPAPPAPLPPPRRLVAAPWPTGAPARVSLDELELLPTSPDWAAGFAAHWRPGEAGGRQRLSEFVAHDLARYADERDLPATGATSRLSPHLRFGSVGPRQAFHASRHRAASEPSLARAAAKFEAELGWREFCYHLLHQFPDLSTRNFQRKFDSMPWRNADPTALRTWQRGRTGYPIVDAGMRELWSTGTMHNRVRMIAASFLVKDMLVDWRVGEDWFWDTLLDADPANNPAGWQWVAGSGADAAPYFRIFNPTLQGEKFDPEGSYVRRFVPELARLPKAYVHRPAAAPAGVLAAAGVRLGVDYPAPMLDHHAARDRALEALKATQS
ncbi:MAG: deoxyribodipyrimidine photo-lyase [Hyphomicrobiales bacterium]|nr:DNA photolyase family protein [Hyphomicrobiales bacterium]MDE2016901.1 deoxyribodipyrimidine photo-lyase [Hyphomicrobiales bacterium]